MPDRTFPSRDRVRGVLLGTMIGDALGMPVEGWPRDAILARHGELCEMLPARLGRGTYTDDTQMALALAEALVDSPGRLDRDRVAARFAERYDPARGYGANTRQVLEAIRSGVPWWEAAARHRPPGGSWANGAAMRVAPVAVAFFDDRAGVARAAERQAEVTGHTHPIGRTGARLQALAVREALAHDAGGRPIDAADFAEALRGMLAAGTAGVGAGVHGAGTEDDADLHRAATDPAAIGAAREFDRALRWIADHPDADPAAVGASLRTGGRASESVPAALWAFLSRPDDPEAAIVRAVSLGGDTDTIGAMAGAITGAYYGAAALPTRWVEALEDGEFGRGYAITLADRLWDAHQGVSR